MVDQIQHSSEYLEQAEPGVSMAGQVTEFQQVPNPLGRRAFIAGATGATAGVLAMSSAASAAAPPAGATYFQSLNPRRLCDTRPNRNFGFTRINSTTIRVKIAGNGNIPTNATAAVFTVAGIRTLNVSNWVQAVPAGTTAAVSNLNMSPSDHVVANLVTVKLGTGGSATKGYVDIHSESPCNIILDIAGAYVPTSSKKRAGRLVTIDPVLRPYDTRLASSNGGKKIADGGIVTIDLHTIVPSHATAVVANVTAVQTSRPGFLTAFPSDQTTVPEASNLNFGAGENRAVGVVTKLGTLNGRRGIKIYVFGGCHLLVDVAGYITGEGAEESDQGLFVPIQPNRMLDTRRATDKAAAGNRSRLWPGWTRSFNPGSPVNGGPTVPSTASAVAMNTTAVNGMGPGFLTVLAAQTVRREVSNVNVAYAGQNVANHVISSISSKGVEVYSNSGCHLICDVTGWFVGNRPTATQGVPADPAPPPAELPWTLSVPQLAKRNGAALVNAVHGGSADPIVDAGHSWHWTGTGKVGQSAAIVVFGHRTSHGGPYYGQHHVRAGDRLYVTTGDRRIYTYKWNRQELTTKFSSDILTASRRVGGPTFTLVACTGERTFPNDQPLGHVAYRIISTFVLESWADIG
jgi:hypothetical protein